MTDTVGIPGNRILSFIERIEHIDEELKALNEGKKEVFSEAKGEGFDVKVLKEILHLRKQDQDERDEQESLLDLYLRAIQDARPRKPKRHKSVESIGRAATRTAHPLMTSSLSFRVKNRGLGNWQVQITGPQPPIPTFTNGRRIGGACTIRRPEQSPFRRNSHSIKLRIWGSGVRISSGAPIKSMT